MNKYIINCINSSSNFRYCVKSNETFIKYMLTKESKYNFDGILGLQILDNDVRIRGYCWKKLIEKECIFYVFGKDLDNEELLIEEYPH